MDPFEISHWESDDLDYLLYSRNRRDWSFAFTHASTSSKYILLSIQCLSRLSPSFELPWDVDWIVTEMIDWFKVRDPALIKEIFCNPDICEESNNRSSTTGSADHRVDGRCTQEN